MSESDGGGSVKSDLSERAVLINNGSNRQGQSFGISGNGSGTTSPYGSNDSLAFDEVPMIFRPKKNKKTYSNNRIVEPGRSPGVTLAWQDLSVYVPIKGKGLFRRHARHRPFKRVLHNVLMQWKINSSPLFSKMVTNANVINVMVMLILSLIIASGIVYPGSLMAIMGASGAGKTTLMNVLAHKAEGSIAIDGEIRVNGMPVGNFMGKISGFVYQQDLFYGTLTVSEHLHFMARMKLDRRLGKWERERRVEELLVELGLKKCEHTRIGNSGESNGLSGGERKRLAFAAEVLTDPPILLCDEPTTGLDSFSAQKIVGMMRSMAAKGKTIVCTIHQPSSQVFSMFDQLLLLADGRTAYMGSSDGALNFLQSMKFICPEEFNPADFFIRTLAVYPGKEEESRQQIKHICDTFSVSPQAKDIEEKVRLEIKNVDFFNCARSNSSSEDSFNDQTILGGHIRRPLWFTQTFWLIWRSMVDSYRNPQIHTVRIIQKLILALLIGLCYFGITLSQMGIQDVQGAVFVFITESTFPSMYGVLHVFPMELPLFIRENKGGLYRCDSYYISKVISLLPGFIFEPFLFTVIAYWMIGLRATSEAFFTTCLIVLITANTAAACGCFFSAAFENISTAVTCLIPFDYILMITGGLFINVGTLPSYIAWTKFFSWFLYANEALTVTQWNNITDIPCDVTLGIPCITTGAEVLESRSFSVDHVKFDFVGLIALYCGFHTFAYLALLLRTRRK